MLDLKQFRTLFTSLCAFDGAVCTEQVNVFCISQENCLALNILYLLETPLVTVTRVIFLFILSIDEICYRDGGWGRWYEEVYTGLTPWSSMTVWWLDFVILLAREDTMNPRVQGFVFWTSWLEVDTPLGKGLLFMDMLLRRFSTRSSAVAFCQNALSFFNVICYL